MITAKDVALLATGELGFGGTVGNNISKYSQCYKNQDQWSNSLSDRTENKSPIQGVGTQL